MKQLLKWADHIEAFILVIAMSVMIISVTVQIFCRYIISMPLDWSEELARFAFTWCIYMGVSYACITRKHLKIDAALFLFPRALRPWGEFIGRGFFLCFALIILWISWNHFYTITFVRVQFSPALRIPMGLVYGAVPVGFTLVAIRLLQDMRRFIRNKEYRQTDIMARMAKEEIANAGGERKVSG